MDYKFDPIKLHPQYLFVINSTMYIIECFLHYVPNSSSTQHMKAMALASTGLWGSFTIFTGTSIPWAIFFFADASTSWYRDSFRCPIHLKITECVISGTSKFNSSLSSWLSVSESYLSENSLAQPSESSSLDTSSSTQVQFHITKTLSSSKSW